MPPGLARLISVRLFDSAGSGWNTSQASETATSVTAASINRVLGKAMDFPSENSDICREVISSLFSSPAEA